MSLNINILILFVVFLCYVIFFLIIKMIMNKYSSLNELYVSNNKRLAFILSIINYDFKADFESLKEIKGIKQNLILEHMNENLRTKKIIKVEKQESRNIRKKSTIARKEASTYLGLIGSEKCRETLERALVNERDSSVKIYISNAITDIRNPKSLKVMIPEIINTKKWYREKAISNILEFGYEVQSYLMDLQYSREIEHIELWVKYANENFNNESKQYLMNFVDYFDEIKKEIMEHYSEKRVNNKTNYRMSYLEEDINQLLSSACRILSNYYYEDFCLPKYYNHYNHTIQTNAFWALSKSNKKENFQILLTFIDCKEHEKAIISVLTQMVEKNPRFLSLLEDIFEVEEAEIVKGRVAQILSSKIEYYILKLNTKNDLRAEKIIIEIIKNRKINELIGFLNINNNCDI